MIIYRNRTPLVDQKLPVSCCSTSNACLTSHPLFNTLFLDKAGQFGAAAGDISPNISGGACEGKTDLTLWYVVMLYFFALAQHKDCWYFSINKRAVLVRAHVPPSHDQSPVQGYLGPACHHTKCGTCYKVTNAGGYGGSSVDRAGSGTVTVQIIDACPASSAFNFCKTEVPANERCGDGSTNSLDIDISAYQQLTGKQWKSVRISTDKSPCFN